MDDTPIVEEALRFPAEGQSLEGVLAYPEAGRPGTSVLLLAPHPHMGGRMDNNVIRHLAVRFAQHGAVTLRFNYRGVGASGISLPPGRSVFDHFATMEREQRYDALLPDARAAHDALAAAVPAPPRRLVVGYSLGAILAGLLAPHVEATHWVGVSPPTARVSLAPWRDLAQPKLFLGGDADFAFDRERFDAEYARLPEPRAFVALPGADHFYRKEEERVYAGIRAWLGD